VHERGPNGKECAEPKPDRRERPLRFEHTPFTLSLSKGQCAQGFDKLSLNGKGAASGVHKLNPERECR
jgi:hypothetical protein